MHLAEAKPHLRIGVHLAEAAVAVAVHRGRRRVEVAAPGAGREGGPARAAAAADVPLAQDLPDEDRGEPPLPDLFRGFVWVYQDDVYMNT